MFEELDPFLRTFLPEERVNVIVSILDSISKVLGVACEDRINTYLEAADDLDSSERADLLDGQIEELLVIALKPLGVELDMELLEPIHFSTVAAILDTLALVDENDDPSLIMAGLEIDGSTEEILCEIVYLVTGKNQAETLPLVRTVNPSLIRHIKAITEELMASQEISGGDQAKRSYERYKQLMKPHAESVVDDYVTGGGGTGLTLTNLAKLLMGEILEGKPESYGYEFIKLSLLSSVPDKSILRGALRLVEYYVSDFNHIELTTKTIKAVGQSWRTTDE